MGLDITIKQKHIVRCSECGNFVEARIVSGEHSGGRAWYPFLESVGYYVPYEKLTEENDWYGKDMELTKEQRDHLFHYCQNNEVYNYHEIAGLVAMAEALGDAVVINADW
jgi:hypothetical protein